MRAWKPSETLAAKMRMDIARWMKKIGPRYGLSKEATKAAMDAAAGDLVGAHTVYRSIVRSLAPR